MKIHATLLLAAFVAPLLHADEATRLKLAGEVIEATQAGKMLDGMKGMMQQMAAAQMKEAMANMSKEKAASMEAMQKEIFEVSMNEAKTIIKAMDKIYADTFTEEELLDIRNFYLSKTGKAMIAKQPVIMQKIMPVIMNMQTTLKPKLDAIIKKYTDDKATPAKS